MVVGHYLLYPFDLAVLASDRQQGPTGKALDLAVVVVVGVAEINHMTARDTVQFHGIAPSAQSRFYFPADSNS